MCYTRRKIEVGVGALRESDDTNFLKLNGQSRNLDIYGVQLSTSPFENVRDEKNDDEIFGELEYESRNTVGIESSSVSIMSVLVFCFDV